MTKGFSTSLTLLVVLILSGSHVAVGGPEDDLRAMTTLFQIQFPDLELQELADGVYAFDESAREQWLDMEDFPPYEIAIEEGAQYFEQPFSNGASYADCFENGGVGVKQNFPYFNDDVGEVITLELAINQCRIANDEEPLPYKTGELAAISAYMAFTSRGNVFDVQVPVDNPGAMAAYEAGKQFFYTRRGQLNFACKSCHVQSAGLKLRADSLSSTLGHATHWPVYRASWGEIGTLHRRFAECNIQVRARPFAAQSIEFRNLEYFLTYMSNDLQLNGPASRR